MTGTVTLKLSGTSNAGFLFVSSCSLKRYVGGGIDENHSNISLITSDKVTGLYPLTNHNDGKLDDTWTRDGIIFVKKGDSVHRITTVREIHVFN